MCRKCLFANRLRLSLRYRWHSACFQCWQLTNGKWSALILTVRCVELTQNCEWITRSIFVKKSTKFLRSQQCLPNKCHTISQILSVSALGLYTLKSHVKNLWSLQTSTTTAVTTNIASGTAANTTQYLMKYSQQPCVHRVCLRMPVLLPCSMI